MIFLVWKGTGWLISIIWLIVGVSSLIIWDIRRDFSITVVYLLLFLITFVAAAIIWLLGRKLNAHRRELYFDENAGEERPIGYQHSFFWIPFEFWAVIMPIINIWLFNTLTR